MPTLTDFLCFADYNSDYFYNHTSDILNFKPCKLIFLNSHIFHILYIDTNKTIFVNIFSEVMSAKMIKMTIMAIIKWPIMVQSVANIIFWTEYEYEYICNTTVDRIRIFEYFWLKYSNIFSSNIWIFFVRIFENHFGQILKYSIEQRGHTACIPRIPRSQLCYLCQSCMMLPSSHWGECRITHQTNQQKREKFNPYN